MSSYRWSPLRRTLYRSSRVDYGRPQRAENHVAFAGSLEGWPIESGRGRLGLRFAWAIAKLWSVLDAVGTLGGRTPRCTAPSRSDLP